MNSYVEGNKKICHFSTLLRIYKFSRGVKRVTPCFLLFKWCCSVGKVQNDCQISQFQGNYFPRKRESPGLAMLFMSCLQYLQWKVLNTVTCLENIQLSRP